MPSNIPHYMRDYSRKRREERKKWAINEFGKKCVKCGSKEDLQFDHKIRETKKINISEMWMYKWEVFVEEIKKCQLLCRKCHIEKCRIDGSFKKRGETKHGTGTAYIHHGCRCELCRNWKREYRKRLGRQVV